MANGRPVTNDKIYELVNTSRLELKGDINRLENKFDNLEAGRLTRAEGNINSLAIDLQKAVNDIYSKIDSVKASGGTLTAKATVVGGIILIILGGFSAAVFYRLIVGGTK